MNDNTTGTVVGVLVILILIIGGVWLYMRGAPAQNQTTENSITFPTAGVTLAQGSTYMLRWHDANTVAVDATGATTTQIFLIDTALLAQGQSVAISDRQYNVPDVGSYQYTVPMSLPEGTYEFEIGTLTSDTFQIASSTK